MESQRWGIQRKMYGAYSETWWWQCPYVGLHECCWCQGAAFHWWHHEFTNVLLYTEREDATITPCPWSSCNNDPMVQNAAARLLTGAIKHDHITPILASLQLPVSFRIQLKILLIVFKALNGQAPSYISDLISYKSTSKPLRSANKALLYVPRSRLKFKGDRAFAVAAPLLWNQLPPDIKSAPSISVFKSRLKAHLYSMAFPEF